MKLRQKVCAVVTALLLSALLSAQEAYRPKFPGDPARSESEAAALGYARVLSGAQRAYKKKHGEYASSLQSLVGQGSFTKRMTSPDRGDYRVRFKGTREGFSLWMDAEPQPGPNHRSFFTDDRGGIRADENKAAGPESPIAKP
jgi:type II secretory pathway pseudopilin PulG